MPDEPTPERKKRYDEDLLVQLVAEGQTSYRKIAEQLDVSPNTVSTIARGVFRRDLYERICATVEDAYRRARRLASSYLCPVVAAHIKHGLEGSGESARKCREFVMKMALGTSDPAGRYVGQPGGRAGHASAMTRAELDLLAAVRREPDAPAFGHLTKRIRRTLIAMVADAPDTPAANVGAPNMGAPNVGAPNMGAPNVGAAGATDTQPPRDPYCQLASDPTVPPARPSQPVEDPDSWAYLPETDETLAQWLVDKDYHESEDVHDRHGTQKPKPPQSAAAKARAHWLAARKHDDAGAHDQAVAEFSAAIDLEPDIPKYYLARSRARDLLGDHPQALEDLDAAIDLIPADPVPWQRRGEFHYAHGRYDAAIDDFNKAVGRRPECEYAYFHRARAFVALEQFQFAIDDLIRATRYRPFWPGYEAAAILLHVARGRMGDDGRQELTNFLNGRVSSLDTWVVPTIEMYIGEMTPQECLAEAANDDERINDHQLCNANFHIGQHYLIAGDTSKAKEHFERAVSMGADRADHCARHAAAVAGENASDTEDHIRTVNAFGTSEYHPAVTELAILAEAEETRQQRIAWGHKVD